MAGPRARAPGVARLAALGVLPLNPVRRAAPVDPGEGPFAALLGGFPDGVVLCDALLSPVRSSAAAGWLLSEGSWAATPAAAACREAAATALDRGGVASVTFEHEGVSWEARAGPLGDPDTPVCVSVRPAASADREALLRAAHDLKAPLHAIRGFGTLLLRENAGPLTADQRGALETISAETDRLCGALSRLLDQARTGTAGDVDLSDVANVAQPTTRPASDLGELARETVARFAAAAAVRGVRLEAVAPRESAVPAAAIGEQDARTVLENLVDNALAAVPAGGAVRVIAEESAAGAVTCRVEDDGPGVPEALLDRIFEPGFRLRDRGGPDGTGLGLAIARELATRAGGSLTAANRHGAAGSTGGAVFMLTVPRAAPDQRRLLRLAPVTSYAALARAHALLDHIGGWRMHSWEEGVLTVELPPGTDARLEAAAAQHGLVCWIA